jgi:hypothetical protein
MSALVKKRADTGVDHALRPRWQQRAEHAGAAGVDCRANDIGKAVDVIVRRVVGIDRHLAFRHEAPAAKNMVRVVMGVDERHHRLVRDPAKLRHDGAGRLDAFGDVDDDHTVLTFQQNGVGQGISHRHIHAIGHLLDPGFEFRALRLQAGDHLTVRRGGRTGPRRCPGVAAGHDEKSNGHDSCGRGHMSRQE